MAGTPIAPRVDVPMDDLRLAIAAWLGRDVAVLGSRPLAGGCINTVLEVAFEGEESPLVLKVSPEPGDAGIEREWHVLHHLRAHTRLPLPRPLSLQIDATAPYSWLLMERVPGERLGEARAGLSEGQFARLQEDMADAVAELHTHSVEQYGAIGEPRVWERWEDRFAQSLSELREDVAGKLSDAAMGTIDRVIASLPSLLAECGEPVLVHGDIWANNVMIHHGRLERFIDPGGLCAPAEHDLAYLQIWQTVDEPFFARYHEHHPPREGYARRRQVYWLATLLIHVWLFGDAGYRQSAERLLAEFRF